MLALNLHSHFSLLRATPSPEALCAAVHALGYSHLALCDRNNLYALPALLNACRRHNLQPLIGAELTADDESLTLLARTAAGYANLCTLLTRRNMEAEFTLAALSAETCHGLILLTTSLPRLEQLAAAGIEVVADLGNRPTATARHLRRAAVRLGVPAVCSQNASLLTDDDAPLHHLLRAIHRRALLSDADNEPPPQPLLPPQTLRDRFAIWPEALAACDQLIARCPFRGPDFGIVMPPFRGAGLPGDILRKAAFAGAHRRYGHLPPQVTTRLEEELQIIEDMGFSSYFLVVRDIVLPKNPDGSRRKRRICGRGSGAASLVAYCLGITNICPVKHNLYFARFLNPGRQDPPDIDIDFASDERDAVLEEVLTEFGDHAAMVCCHIGFQPKLALRETARTFGIPAAEIATMSGRRGRHLLLQLKRGEQPQNLAAPWPEIFRLAAQLPGMPRTLSVHPGGVVITPEPICRYVPVERAAKGVPVIQWEKDGAEDAGLVKIDLLGNRSLGVIRDATAAIRARGLDLPPHWSPEEDPATRRRLAAGRTMGCFYIESPATRLLAEKAHSGTFDQLVIQSSIIRPAANNVIHDYLRRLHGAPWQHLHPDLAGVLDETFGLMVYQEDVSKVAVKLAGFSDAEGDWLRKAMSRKDRALQLADGREKFVAGCRKRGIDEPTINSLWEMIMSFAGYSFCKPHSASYARVSFEAAWFKEHHPAEFMAAVLSNGGGFYSAFAYVSEARRLGLRILPPDIHRSPRHWQGNSRDHTLRVGLMAIKRVSRRSLQTLVEERRHAPFADMADFLHRVQPEEDSARALIFSGALDSLAGEMEGGMHGHRATLLWELLAFKRITCAPSGSLFPPTLPERPRLAPLPRLTLLREEYRLLGFLTGGHPITLFADRTRGMVKAAELRRHVGRRITIAGWLLTGKIISTKNGEVMEFLSFEDETDIFETTFFPPVFARYGGLLEQDHPFLLRGVVETDFGALTLTVEEVARMKSSVPPWPSKRQQNIDMQPAEAIACKEKDKRVRRSRAAPAEEGKLHCQRSVSGSVKRSLSVPEPQ